MMLLVTTTAAAAPATTSISAYQCCAATIPSPPSRGLQSLSTFRLFKLPPISPPRTKLFCSAHDFPADPSEDNPPWSLDAELDKVILSEESQALLKDLKAAAHRVAAAKRELEDLDKQQSGTGIREARMERFDAADSLVAECEREVFAAEAAVKMAEIALVKARAGSSVRDLSEKWDREGTDEDSERVESGKAASVAALVGALASLPWSIAMQSDIGFELIVRSGLVLASCALFGITYRYTVRRNLGNTQLKAGCAAAFALVRGMGQIDSTKVFLDLLEGTVQKLLVVCTIFGESFAIFFFAAVALDYCFREGYVNPFPSRRD